MLSLLVKVMERLQTAARPPHLQLAQLVLVLPLQEVNLLQKLLLVELELAHGGEGDVTLARLRLGDKEPVRARTGWA